MSKSYDLCIIGAGPAGMEAALCAQDFGISVLVLDENMQAGGQIYRQADVADSEILTALGVEYDTGLCQRFMQAAINFECGARVWDIADQCVFFINNRGQSCKIAARRIIIATGAMERPAIVSGWQLPGCMGAGAVQSLLKGSNIVPVGKFVLAGSGPLLLLLAVQLLRLHIRPQVILWHSAPKNLRPSHLIKAIPQWREIAKGLAWLRMVKAAGIPIIQKFDKLRILGETQVNGISFTTPKGPCTIACDLAFLHHGVVPSTHLAAVAGCEIGWDSQMRAFGVVSDLWGASSQPHIAVIGDGAHIMGAKAARAQGQCAAWDALYRLGHITFHTRNIRARNALRICHHQRLLRPFIDHFMPPIDAWVRGWEAEILCRCEGVSAATIAETAATTNCTGPNQMKVFSRAGMGPCQGRMCGLAITEIIAYTQNRTPEDVGFMRIRAPVKPMSFGEMAAYGDDTKGQITGMFSDKHDGHY